MRCHGGCIACVEDASQHFMGGQLCGSTKHPAGAVQGPTRGFNPTETTGWVAPCQDEQRIEPSVH